MTASRKLTVGAVLVSVLLLVAGWFLLIAPKRAQVADLESATQSQLDDNSQVQTQLSLLEQEYKNLPEKQAELAALRTKLPESPDLPPYIRELNEVADKSGVALTSMTPATAVSMGGLGVVPGAEGVLTPDTLAALNVDVAVAGEWDGIRLFVNNIEETSRYTLVGGLNIADNEDTEPGAPPLVATLNARIYLVPGTPDTAEAIPGVEAPAPLPTTTTAP